MYGQTLSINGSARQYRNLWHSVCNERIIHAHLHESLTIILFFLRISRQENYFSMPPNIDTACSAGTKMYACFAGVWIANSWYTKNVSIKLPVTSEFRSAHQERRGQGEIADFTDQDGDHTGSLALLSQDPGTLADTSHRNIHGSNAACQVSSWNSLSCGIRSTDLVVIIV